VKIIFLGTGWPVPNPDRVGSSQLLEIAGRYYLIDCGNNATTQMVRAGVNPLAWIIHEE
jgi:ribonuclease BN (tRNA processing enzyme)